MEAAKPLGERLKVLRHRCPPKGRAFPQHAALATHVGHPPIGEASNLQGVMRRYASGSPNKSKAVETVFDAGLLRYRAP